MSKKPSALQEQAYKERKASCLYWIINDKIKFPPNLDFDPANFMFQFYLFGMFPLPMKAENMSGIQSRIMGGKKAAQIGITVWAIITSIHGLKYGLYPNGVIHLFPTDSDSQYISKTKVGPMIDINPDTIKPFIGKVDEVGARQIGDGFYYMRGASQTRQIDGQAGSSSKAKSITGDRLIYDEYDEMDMDMVELFKKRVYASKRKEEVYISTPTLPDYGIDKKYNESNQCMWAIKCSRCSKETILEMEFPEILVESHGEVYRVCKHCRKPLSDRDIASGQWVAQYPSRTRDSSMVWISSLAVPNRDPRDIYRMMQSTDPVVLKNLYNSDLAMPYLQSDDALTKQDIYACCGSDALTIRSSNINAAGVDVKSRHLHVVIGYPKSENNFKVIWVGRLGGFEELHDIFARLNVRCAIIDYEPETRKVREFRKKETKIKIHMIDYQERLKAEKKIDDITGILTVRRTETMDQCAETYRQRRIELPRRNSEIDEVAREMVKTVKVLEEDKKTGSRRYTWKKIGPEHYFHASSYFIMACGDYKILADNKRRSTMPKKKKKPYDPFDAVRGTR